MRRIFLSLMVTLVTSAAPALEEDEKNLFTETIRSTEGNYALSIDPGSRVVTVIRTDQRAGTSPQLRVRLLLPKGTSRVVELKFEVRPGGSNFYRGKDQGWDGVLQGWSLESSRDGRQWGKLELRKK